MNTSAKIDASELSTAPHNHLDASVLQTNAIRQVNVLQLQI